jgi:YHS domain-containing protein
MKKLFLFVLLTIFSTVQMNAQQKQVFTKNNIAVNGYDVVAYFADSNAVKGNEEHTVNWKDAKWLFATAEHASLFKANPEKYAPQYGGYCAFGCSRGYKAKTDPDAWTIVNGKLYLNYNSAVKNAWSKDIENYIKKADAAWALIKDEAMKQ